MKDTIHISGVIDRDNEFYASEFGVVGNSHIIDRLAQSNSDNLEVVINSVGGSVLEGWAMFHTLLNSGKEITTITNGVAASMASVLALLPSDKSKRKITKGSQIMIHNPWSMVSGDAESLRQFADQLEETEEEIAEFYKNRIGGRKSTIKSMMRDETWLGANSSKELGFVGEIMTYEEDKKKKKIDANALMSTIKCNGDELVKGLDILKEINKDLIKPNVHMFNSIKKALGLDKKEESKAYNTEDGKVLETKTEEPLKEGQEVALDGEEVDKAEVKLEDGVKVEIEEGKIIKVIDPLEEVTSMKAELETKAKEFKGLKEELVAFKKEMEYETETVLNLIKEDYEAKLLEMSQTVESIKENAKNIKENILMEAEFDNFRIAEKGISLSESIKQHNSK